MDEELRGMLEAVKKEDNTNHEAIIKGLEMMIGDIKKIENNVNTIKTWIVSWGIVGIILALISLLNSCASGY